MKMYKMKTTYGERSFSSSYKKSLKARTSMKYSLNFSNKRIINFYNFKQKSIRMKFIFEETFNN